MTFNLQDYETEHYHIVIGPSAIRDYQGNVYRIQNKATGVYEHESPYISEALGYLLALEEKLLTSTTLFWQELCKKGGSAPANVVSLNKEEE